MTATTKKRWLLPEKKKHDASLAVVQRIARKEAVFIARLLHWSEPGKPIKVVAADLELLLAGLLEISELGCTKMNDEAMRARARKAIPDLAGVNGVAIRSFRDEPKIMYRYWLRPLAIAAFVFMATWILFHFVNGSATIKDVKQVDSQPVMQLRSGFLEPKGSKDKVAITEQPDGTWKTLDGRRFQYTNGQWGEIK